MNEPKIVINGLWLTEGQAMAVRVAVTHFHSYVNTSRDALGPISDGYAARLCEVEQAMVTYSGPSAE